MYKTSFLVLSALFVLLSTSSCKTVYTHDTGESLGQSFFKIVQKKDREALQALLPNQKDMVYVLSVSGIDKEARMMLQKKIEDPNSLIWKELKQKTNAAWKNLFEEMEKAGFNPRKASYRKSEVTSSQEESFESADINILMDYAGSVYRIQIEEAGKVPRGWLLGGDGFHWEGKVEK
jgi:hypothetical protein